MNKIQTDIYIDIYIYNKEKNKEGTDLFTQDQNNYVKQFLTVYRNLSVVTVGQGKGLVTEES